MNMTFSCYTVVQRQQKSRCHVKRLNSVDENTNISDLALPQYRRVFCSVWKTTSLIFMHTSIYNLSHR